MKAVNKNLSSIIMCVYELLIGILLLINPIGFTSGIIIAAGIIISIIGTVMIVRYFKMEAFEAAESQLLVKGLILVLFGLFCIFKSNWFIVTFPLITIIYGIIILVTGLCKAQLSIDLLRFKNKKWVWIAIGAGISIVCGIIVLFNPFASTVAIWIFTGITLIVEAVFDVIALFMSNLLNEEEKR